MDQRRDKASVGGYGSKLITDTTVTAPTAGYVFTAIQFLSDTVFTTLTGNVTGSIVGVTFIEGSVLYGRFSLITLASGSVVAYEGVV